MPYNNIITRTEAQALVPEQVSAELLTGLEHESVAMRLLRQVRMSTNQTRMPVVTALPVAYFVTGDNGLKQTTEVNWDNKFLNVEELAAIVPIPEAVLDDQSYDVWGNIKPLLEQAIARAIDAAIVFGTNKPASWGAAIVPQAVTASHAVARGTNNAAAGGLAGDFSDAFALVEADGYDVNGIVANTTYKGRIRQTRATDGQRSQGFDVNGIYGVAPQFPLRGMWPSGLSAAEAIVGDFTQAILGVRQDFTYKILDQAVITDNTGAIIYNLAQQDMVAMRIVFRCAYQVANVINYDNATEATRWPWAVVRSPAA